MAYNDGDGTGPLWAYVDDVEICVAYCGPPMGFPGGGPSVSSDLCWKSGGYPDYAPNGVPDFDQKVYAPEGEGLTADGPATAANSLWWYDSKHEPGAVPLPTVSDGYPLVEAYDGWDDHDQRNVAPLIGDLAERIHTDGLPDHEGDWIGTRPGDMVTGIRDYLRAKELLHVYSVTLEEAPSFDSVRDRVKRSEDVLLLLGLWEHQPGGWRRLGGHWVTAVGVDCHDLRRIGISDPFIDSAERGYAGEYYPGEGHAYPHPPTVHDDAAFVSHDLYGVWEKMAVEAGARWGLLNYIREDRDTGGLYPDPTDFWEANIPTDWEAFQAEAYQGGPIQVGVEYAIAIWPAADTVTLSTLPADASVSVGEVFAVDLMAESRTQPFDTVQAYIDYDASLLECVDGAGLPVTEVTPDQPTMVLQNAVDNVSGRIDYAVRVPLGDPALTGRVRVARLHFRARVDIVPPGTWIEFAWTEARRTDVLSGFEPVLGRIGETRVRAITPATVQGSIALQGRPAPPHASWQIPLTVELLDPATGTTLQTTAATTDDQGRFALAGLEPGTYDLRVKGMHTLANRWSDLLLVSGANAVDMGELLEGDTDNDNDVDAHDASVVNLAFGSVPLSGNWDPRADLNEDSVVNGVDMGLIAASYGLSGDVEVGTMASTHMMAEAVGLWPEAYGLSAASAGTVSIAFDPGTIAVDVGDVFEVQLMLHAGAQPVDSVEAHITFPPGTLLVVDGSGSLTTTVQSGAAFDLELANSVDNAAGTIHYAATMLGGSLDGDIHVATLRFKALAPALHGSLRFSIREPRTDVLYLGQSVLGSWPAAPIRVAGEGGVYLPMIVK